MQTDGRAQEAGPSPWPPWAQRAAEGCPVLSSLAGPGVEGNLSFGADILRWCRLGAVNHSAGQAPRDRLGVELCPFLSLAAWGPPSLHPRPKSWYKAGPAGVCGGGGAGTPCNGQGSKYRDAGGPGCRPRATLAGRCRAAHAGPCLAARGRCPALSCPRAQGSAGHRRAVFSRVSLPSLRSRLVEP